MPGIARRATVAIAWLALLAGCDAKPSEPAPNSAPTAASSKASHASSTAAPADVEARLARLKAELAITPHYCSLEARPCRAQNRASIERGIELLLARCASEPRRSFERCLEKERPAVLRELPPPVGSTATAVAPAA